MQSERALESRHETAKSTARNQQQKLEKQKKVESKKRVSLRTKVLANSRGIHEVNQDEEKEGCGGKDLQRRKVSSVKTSGRL